MLTTVLFTDVVGSTEKAGGARRSRLAGSWSRVTDRRCAPLSLGTGGGEVEARGTCFRRRSTGPARGRRVRQAIADPERACWDSRSRRPACTGEVEARGEAVKGLAASSSALWIGAKPAPPRFWSITDREGSGRRLGARLRGSVGFTNERGSRRVAPFRRGHPITRDRAASGQRFGPPRWLGAARGCVSKRTSYGSSCFLQSGWFPPRLPCLERRDQRVMPCRVVAV